MTTIAARNDATATQVLGFAHHDAWTVHLLAGLVAALTTFWTMSRTGAPRGGDRPAE
jgi:hypothetical protein